MSAAVSVRGTARSVGNALRIAAMVYFPVGCTSEPQQQPIPIPAAAEPKPAAATTPAPPEQAMQELAPGVMIPKHNAEGLPIMTPMEFALLLIDPQDLDLEGRRKRAFARRKVVMNRPESPAARALRDVADAHRSGELDVGQNNDTVLFPRGTTPTTGRPPAGSRPPAGAPQPP